MITITDLNDLNWYARRVVAIAYELGASDPSSIGHPGIQKAYQDATLEYDRFMLELKDRVMAI